MDWLVWIPAFVGHVGICSFFFNRTHATAWPQFWRKLIEKIVVLGSAFPLLALPIWLWISGSISFFAQVQASWLLAAYLWFCVAASVFFLVTWLWRINHYRVPQTWQNRGSEVIDAERELKTRLTHGLLAQTLRWFPGNEATKISFEDYRISLRKIPQGSQLKVCQISDLHLTGQIDVAYFRLLVERVNRWQPDLVFVTGDIVDEPHCLDWIPSIFEPLRAKVGKYYILGNHDRRIRPESELRERLVATGLTRVGGEWLMVDTEAGTLALAGNELPWFAGAEALQPLPGQTDCTRILLTHSPDQIEWAKQFGFDLIFAGHTHGGQIRLPIFGPMICPSRYGVRYASGPFQVGSGLMHVSRGISGDRPIRIKCPPEVGFFTLVSPVPESQADG